MILDSRYIILAVAVEWHGEKCPSIVWVLITRDVVVALAASTHPSCAADCRLTGRMKWVRGHLLRLTSRLRYSGTASMER